MARASPLIRMASSAGSAGSSGMRQVDPIATDDHRHGGLADRVAMPDLIICLFRPRGGAGKPFAPDGLERGQRRILGEATGRFHRYPKPSERTSRTPGGRRNSARSIRMMTSEP